MPKFEPIDRFLVVEKSNFRLKLYTRKDDTAKFRVAERYSIAIGQKGYETPSGVYLINTRARHPDWLLPDSDWVRNAGLNPGDIIPGGHPDNPLKERWLGITDPSDGIGIHGTDNIESLGSEASHGCIRMRPFDVVRLYPEVPKYTPIHILD